MPFTLTKEFRFEASHVLPSHPGRCRRLHGHSWLMRVVLRGKDLFSEGPQAGMLRDYGDISRVVRPLVEDYLDHYHLNATTGLMNPTSEELARWIFEKIHPNLPELVAVEVDETCTSSCHYEL